MKKFKVIAKINFLHDQLGTIVAGQEIEVNKKQLRSVANLVTEPDLKTKPEKKQEKETKGK